MKRWRLVLNALPALLLLWGFVIEPRRLTVRHETLALPRWPQALSGQRVAALSDIHVGPSGRARVEEIVARTNAEKPDLIVLLGDYVTGHRPDSEIAPEMISSALAGLHAPLGVFAVLGNHDWWTDGPRVRRALEAAGIEVIEDRAVEISRDGTHFQLAGIGDFMTRESSPTLAMRNVPPGAPLLLITHNLDVFPQVPAQAALTLAGHTHGGQVRLPFYGPPVVPSHFGQRYAAGHVVEDGRHLFVTTGIGTSILTVRIGVPPEIAVVMLDAERPPR
jgi:predicted MPP superfamily phosphohydrolase